MRPIEDLPEKLTAAGEAPSASALRLVALLWSACPEAVLEKAARSDHPVERVASARHPRTPASAQPWIRSSGAEIDGVFWLSSVEHLTTLGGDDSGGRPWLSLDEASRALAQLAAAGELVDTAAFSVRQDLVEAVSPATAPSRLTVLGLHPLPLVTARLLARRDLPEGAELGMTLAGVHPLILEKLALRSRSPLTLARLAGRRESPIELEVMSNPYLHPETLVEIVEQRRFPSYFLARNPALTPALQLAFARRRYEGAAACFQGQGERVVAEALAGNPRCTPETLLELLERPGLLRELFSASHAGVPASRLTSLAESPQWNVRQAVARNPSLPPEAARRLVGQLETPADPHGFVGAALAGNAACPPEILRQLHDRARPAWHDRLAENPACPEDMRRDYEQRAVSDLHLRRALARNWRTSPSLLAAWADDAEPGVRFQLAGNPAAPPELLARLAGSAEWSTASAAAKNPSCPREALERIVADDTASMRGALFDNPACDLALLEQAFCALVEDQLFESSMVGKARNGIWLRTHPRATDTSADEP